jgi:hypothetical protein
MGWGGRIEDFEASAPANSSLSVDERSQYPVERLVVSHRQRFGSVIVVERLQRSYDIVVF